MARKNDPYLIRVEAHGYSLLRFDAEGDYEFIEHFATRRGAEAEIKRLKKAAADREAAAEAKYPDEEFNLHDYNAGEAR